MNYWILAGIVVALWLAFELWPQKPFFVQLSEYGGLKPALSRLLAHGRDNAELNIVVDAPGHVFTFKKRLGSSTGIDIHAQLVREPWSEEHYPALLGELSRRGIGYTEETDKQGRSVLVIPLGQNLALGHTVAQTAFDAVFKVPLFDRQAQFARMSVARHPSVTGRVKETEEADTQR